MAYGTPRSPEEIEPYYTHIRRGNKPPTELLEDLKRRYEMIGEVSPLAKIREDQTAALEKELNSRSSDRTFQAYIGLKHISPFVEDAVRQMHEDGIEEAVSIVLAPHYSTLSVKSYNDRAKKEAEKLGYTGKVRQIITGSIGFDDWEWGVSLFSDDPLTFKKLVSEMRFDEVSARFGEFGPFYVGCRLTNEGLASLLSDSIKG
jgi:hypothetical protein